MKRLLATTIGIIGIALTLALTTPDNEPITIVLKPTDVAQYQKHTDNIINRIENSDLTGKEIQYIKKQLDSGTLVLLKNIKPIDTAKKK